MISSELLDELINFVEDSGGILSIQVGTLAERPQSQKVGYLYIDITTRSIYRFNGEIWEHLPNSALVIDPFVSKEVTESSEPVEATKPEEPSQIVRAKSPF
ncbi:hypothetical protein ACERII_05315 [Evansella sp. AB-rgal1]|uniref:hypothetical protein n=1 Tax=Evansella sp. AB-rgal1 TaxID=3242696 RepID=UPI00359F0A30